MPARVVLTQGQRVPLTVPAALRVELARLGALLMDSGFDLVLEKATPKAPTWKIGDVVVLKFPGNPTPYTYVHDGRHFPGKTVHRSNAEMRSAWDEGAATLLVRDGKPFEDVPLAERPRRSFAQGGLVRAARPASRSRYLDYGSPW